MKWLKLLGINFAVFSGILLGLELLGQVAFYVAEGRLKHEGRDRLYEARQLFERHPWLVGQPRAGTSLQRNGVRISINEHRRRWTGATADADYRIAVLGGSSTFGTGVADADSWPAQLQQALGPQFAVANFGMLGYSSTEAIIQMALQLADYQPHLVIHYHGWNDLRSYHINGPVGDAQAHGHTQFRNLGIDAFNQHGLFEKLANVSTMVGLAANIRKKSSKARKAQTSASEQPDPIVDAMFQRNLGTLYTLGQQLGATTLFLPQALNYQHYRQAPTGQSSWWMPGIANQAVPTLMKRFNQYSLSVCPATSNGDCLSLPTVEQLSEQADNFVDDGHFSAQGGAKLVAQLLPPIKQAIKRQYQQRP